MVCRRRPGEDRFYSGMREPRGMARRMVETVLQVVRRRGDGAGLFSMSGRCSWWSWIIKARFRTVGSMRRSARPRRWSSTSPAAAGRARRNGGVREALRVVRSLKSERGGSGEVGIVGDDGALWGARRRVRACRGVLARRGRGMV